MNDLELFYNYYKHLHTCIDDMYNKYNHNGEKVTISAEMFKFVIDYYGFNGMPKKVDDKQFQNMITPTLFHGYKHYNYGANALVHFDYHYGMGYTHGIFLTPDISYALLFTRSGPKTTADEGKVLSCKLDTQNYTTLTDIRTLKNYNRGDIPEDCMCKDKLIALMDFYDELEKKGETKYAKTFVECMKNPSIFAVYLGFDYMIETGTRHRIVFNRGVITAPEAEFDRFCENSSHYKGGSFDFHDREYPEDIKTT